MVNFGQFQDASRGCCRKTPPTLGSPASDNMNHERPRKQRQRGHLNGSVRISGRRWQVKGICAVAVRCSCGARLKMHPFEEPYSRNDLRSNIIQATNVQAVSSSLPFPFPFFSTALWKLAINKVCSQVVAGSRTSLKLIGKLFDKIFR